MKLSINEIYKIVKSAYYRSISIDDSSPEKKKLSIELMTNESIIILVELSNYLNSIIESNLIYENAINELVNDINALGSELDAPIMEIIVRYNSLFALEISYHLPDADSYFYKEVVWNITNNNETFARAGMLAYQECVGNELHPVIIEADIKKNVQTNQVINFIVGIYFLKIFIQDLNIDISHQAKMKKLFKGVGE